MSLEDLQMLRDDEDDGNGYEDEDYSDEEDD